MRAKFGRDPTAGSKKLPFKFISRYRLIIFTNIAQEKRRLHHLQYRFLKFYGGGPSDPFVPPKGGRE